MILLHKSDQPQNGITFTVEHPKATASHVSKIKQSRVHTVSPRATSFVILNAIRPKANADSSLPTNAVHSLITPPAF